MRDVTKLGLRLFIFTLIAALALAVTNEITSGPIAQQELAAGQAAQRAVLPEAEIFETQEIQTAPEYDQITELYVGKTGDEVVGYVMTASPQGYGGPIPITLGIGADGSIHGVSVGDLQETAGLGSKVGEEPFTSQFPGLAADPAEIDAHVQTISGATISSQAFVTAVRQMTAYSKDVLGVVPNAAVPTLEGDDLVRKEFVDAAEAFEALDVMSLLGDYETIQSVYTGTVGDDAVGYVFELSSKGFADQIGLRMGITTDGVISKVVMTANNETPDYGTKTTDPAFCGQFDGNAATVEGYMEGVDVMSGATVSSNAVFKAVGQAVDFYNQYLVPKPEEAGAGNVYEVTGFQPMKVEITVEDGKITSFEVTEHNETPGYGADVIAAGFDSLIGQDIATAEFDVVSGATMTCNAINEALKQAAEATGTGAEESVPVSAEAETETASGNVYEVTGFQPMKVEITVEDGKITSFAVTEHNETPGYGADVIAAGFDSLIGQDIATAEFDVVSGATMTCNAINEALKQAAEATGTGAEESVPASTEAEPETVADGNVYEVTGFQPMKVEIAVEDGKIASFAVTEHNETAGFGADLIAEGFDSLIGQDIATAKFDVVSGVTLTSNAINDALAQAAAAAGTGAEESVPASTEAEPETVADGNVYEVTGFQPMKVEIAVEDGKIASFAVTEHNETAGFGADLIAEGFDSLIGQDIATAKFDVVSGVTLTSNAINDALAQAAAATGTGAEAAATTGSSSGVYEVTGFQPMKVEITVEDGKITSFAVTEHNETPSYGADVIAAGFDSLIGQDIATAEFDVVSGATMTCNAINEALKQAAEATGAGTDESVPASTEAEPETVADGNVYEVTGFQPMKVEVVVEDGKVASVTVTEHNETAGFGADVIAAGFDSLIGQDIATAEFDVVSGVTLTCNAINDALAQAAAAAGTGAEESVPASTEAEPETVADGNVYEVTGFQPMKVEIAVEDGKIASFAVTEHNETAGFGADVIAAGFDSLIGQDIATAEFDVVSGATMTCNAINEALAQAAEATGTGAETAATTGSSSGVYEVKGFQPMKVEITVEDGKITSFAVTEHNETAGFGADVIAEGFDSLIGQDIATAKFDVVSGVTLTSNAINDALAQAAEATGTGAEAVASTGSSSGVYEVKGFQPMKVEVVVEDGKVASVTVTEHNETAGFGADLIAEGFDSLIGQDIATAKFDVVSGVTLTSNAINDALAQAAEATGTGAEAAATTGSSSGVYEVKGFQPMKVEIAVEDGKITSFAVVEHNETPDYGADVIAAGFDSLIGQDIATAEFDVVSGATMTSNAINEALAQAAEGVQE